LTIIIIPKLKKKKETKMIPSTTLKMFRNTSGCACLLPTINLVIRRRAKDLINYSAIRQRNNFSRTPTRVYLPRQGEMSSKQTLAKLPPTLNKNNASKLDITDELKELAEAGERFRYFCSVICEYY